MFTAKGKRPSNVNKGSLKGKECSGSDLLTIPIYLNTKIVFDMVATIENGFSEVTSIQMTSDQSKNTDLSAAIGTENSFSLFNIGLKASKTDNRIEHKVESEDRTHTPVSLYQHLNLFLSENGLIKKYDENLNIGDFVELSGTLRLNPMIDFLSNFQSFWKVYESFDDAGSRGNIKGSKERQNNKNIKTMIDTLLDAFKTEGSVDVICRTGDTDVVLQTDSDYFIKKNINEIVDGEFKVLGKIFRICREEGESISLLRNTSLSLFKKEMLNDMLRLANTNDIFNAEKLNLEMEISSPTILVIPIAIYI